MDINKRQDYFVRDRNFSSIICILTVLAGNVIFFIIFNNYINRGIVLYGGAFYIPSWIIIGMYYLSVAMALLQIARTHFDVFSDMNSRKLLEYMLFPFILCTGYRVLMEGALVLFPAIITFVFIYVKKNHIKHEKKKQRRVVAREFIYYVKLAIIILSIVYCAKEVIIRVIVLQCEWTIHAKEYEEDNFDALKYHEDLSFYQKVQFSKVILENELYYLGIDEPVKLVVDNDYTSEVLAYYNDEMRMVDVELKCLERRTTQQLIDTVLHESYHILQHQWITSEDELDLSNLIEQEMFNILKNEKFDIYIGKLIALEDKYAQYYYSLTEYSARKYSEERIKYYLFGKSSKSYSNPTIEYHKWLNQIPIYGD